MKRHALAALILLNALLAGALSVTSSPPPATTAGAEAVPWWLKWWRSDCCRTGDAGRYCCKDCCIGPTSCGGCQAGS